LTSSEAKGLANNELGEYEFLVSIIIWYDILYAVNLVSKELQSKDMLIDVAIEKVQALISFFNQYRETGFSNALEAAKEIALDMDIGTTFRKKGKLKERGILMKIRMTQMLPQNLQRNYLDAAIL
jgi:hypothetical protein